MTLKQMLKDIVALNKQAYGAWAQAAQLRKELLSKLLDPAYAEEAAGLRGYVSICNRKGKLDLPEVAMLRSSIAEAKTELLANPEVQQQVYDAQLALQQAEERLAQLTRNEAIAEMEHQLALLEHQHANAQPELTKSLVVRAASETL